MAQEERKTNQYRPGDKTPAQDALQKFENEFGNEHPHFVPELLRICPELTYTEQLICSMIRARMKSKHIADLLVIALSTVGTHRTNIRKKLDLKGGPRLDAFLHSI